MRHLKRPLRALLLSCLLCRAASASPVFINEFHYDNAGTDSGEFVEIAGPAGTDLSGWWLLLYNGSNGQPYGQWSLDGVLGDDTGTGFGFRVLSFAANGLQNGPADGLALLDAGNQVREFLSYEGLLNATGGPASGLTGMAVPVGESGSTPVGASLQRTGSGSRPGDFVWQAFASATPGGANHGQRLAAANPLPAGSPWPVWLLGLLWLVRRPRCGDNDRRHRHPPG